MCLYDARDDKMYYVHEYIPKRALREKKKQILTASSLCLLKHSLGKNLKGCSLLTHISDAEDPS